jgi:hypothetical protein
MGASAGPVVIPSSLPCLVETSRSLLAALDRVGQRVAARNKKTMLAWIEAGRVLRRVNSLAFMDEVCSPRTSLLRSHVRASQERRFVAGRAQALA